MSSTGLKNIHCDTIETDLIVVQGNDLLFNINDISNNLFNNYYKQAYVDGSLNLIKKDISDNYYKRDYVDGSLNLIKKDISDNYYNINFYDSSYNFLNNKFNNYYDKAYITAIETNIGALGSALETTTGIATGAATVAGTATAGLLALSTAIPLTYLTINDAASTYLKINDATSIYYTKSYIDTSFNNLNANNITSGTLSIARGGTGLTTLTAGQILIGNGSSILQTSALSFNNTTKTLTITGDIIASGILAGIGTGITSINAANINTGLLSVSYGGTGLSTLVAGQLLIGNGSSILQTSII